MRRAERVWGRVAVVASDVHASLREPPRGGGAHDAAADHSHAHYELLRRDAGDGLSRLDWVADLEQQLLDDARDRRGDLGVDLVGVRLHQRLTLGHVLAAVLAPRA